MATAVAAAFDRLRPMEAKLVDRLPADGGWQYEPKWDGFRALVLRDGVRVAIRSKSGKPLDRYFPELVAAIAGTRARSYILDGEIILPIGEVLSFDALQARLHPAASRIDRLARETPAELMLFDCLWTDGGDIADRPLPQRRERLEAWHGSEPSDPIRLSPFSHDPADARDWLAHSGGALDGVVAKAIDAPYRPGERAMLKVKQRRTADCVVGGFRTTEDGSGVASLLLGLYDDDGKLDHVGFTSAIAADERAGLLRRLAPLVAPPGFTGKAPGGPSRWTRDRSSDWSPLKPDLVVEVVYDQITGGRFRHGTRLLRWRPDKAPEQCTRDQLVSELRASELRGLFAADARSGPAGG